MDLRIGESIATHLGPPGKIGKPELTDATEGAKDFAQFLNNAVKNISAAEHRADELTAAFALGEPIEVHEVLMAVGKAEMAMRLFLELRNKVIDAYQEIMRMPV